MTPDTLDFTALSAAYLTTDFMIEWSHRLDWNILSNNTYLDWSEQLIYRFDRYWNWKLLIENKMICWTCSDELRQMRKYHEN